MKFIALFFTFSFIHLAYSQDPTVFMLPPQEHSKYDIEDTNKVYVFVDIPAQFPGGASAMRLFLSQNVQYPEFELKNKIDGKVYVQFVVEKDGSVTNPDIQRCIPESEGFRNETLKVLKLMPKWTPGQVEGKLVRSTFNLPLTFKI